MKTIIKKKSVYINPEKNDDSVKVYGDILDLAKKYLSSDDFKEIENGENFDNITFTINNNNFTLSCKEYNTEYKFCMEKSVNIDNKIKLYYEDFADYNGFYIMITDKYYVVQFSNGVTQYGSVYVYDKNGNELVKTDSTTIYTMNSGVTKYITIFENKLYFIKHVNCINTLSYIDLNNSNLNIIELDTESTEGANEC